jgi:ribosomal-protein-alanine N-acetyltransferase
MTPAAMAVLHKAAFSVPRPWTQSEFVDLLSDPFVFVAGDARGFVLGRAVAGEAEVLTLAVDHALRRQGLGRGLVAAFIAGATLREAEVAFLEVAADNAAAIALYEGAGFAKSGRRKGYFQTPDGTRIDALVMTRLLIAPNS